MSSGSRTQEGDDEGFFQYLEKPFFIVPDIGNTAVSCIVPPINFQEISMAEKKCPLNREQLEALT